MQKFYFLKGKEYHQLANAYPKRILNFSSIQRGCAKVALILFNSHLFFSQKMAANEPEKKIPSTAAKATILSP